MTLAQWEANAPARTREHLPNCRVIPYHAWIWGAIAWDLWHLSDWRVHGVTGGSIWLVPREVKK